ESTWPAASWAAARAVTSIRLVASSWAPAAFLAARSWLSAARYADAPSGAMTRTFTRAAPEPNPAITDGAYSLSRRLPNWLLTAGVATTTSARSGSATAGPSASRLAAGIPRDCKAEHMRGSHATIALRLTRCETQPAAIRPPWPCPASIGRATGPCDVPAWCAAAAAAMLAGHGESHEDHCQQD